MLLRLYDQTKLSFLMLIYMHLLAGECFLTIILYVGTFPPVFSLLWSTQSVNYQQRDFVQESQNFKELVLRNVQNFDFWVKQFLVKVK